MNKYELALVLSPALDEEGRAAEVAKVQATLERFGAKIEKVDDWGKRKLAYEIAKVNEGFYSFISFTADTTASQHSKHPLLHPQKSKLVCVLWKTFCVT